MKIVSNKPQLFWLLLVCVITVIVNLKVEHFNLVFCLCHFYDGVLMVVVWTEMAEGRCKIYNQGEFLITSVY